MMTQKELTMNKDYFAMYTPAGDQAVADMVATARRLAWSWPEVQFQLQVLSRTPGCEETLDTAVRECVYDALGFGAQGVGFYDY
jgi:hypothetical protein